MVRAGPFVVAGAPHGAVHPVGVGGGADEYRRGGVVETVDVDARRAGEEDLERYDYRALTVTVKLRYPDFSIVTRARTLEGAIARDRAGSLNTS